MRKYKIGDVIDTPKGKVKLLYRIAGYTDKITGSWRQPRWIIQVLKTGTVLNVQQGNLINGKFVDFRERTVYGVGYIGSDIKIPERSSNSIIRRIYDLWANMLKRCYGNYDKHECYKQCSVDPRWHNFTCFLNTIQKVEGYALWEDKANWKQRVALDKDIKVSRNKVYSMDLCKFVYESENAKCALNKRWHSSNDTV